MSFLNKKKYIDNFLVTRYSQFWLKQVDEYGFTDYHKNILHFINSIKGVVNGREALECGIGTGYPFAANLAQNGWNVSGIDISPALINKCREVANYKHLNINCTVGNIEALPYNSCKYDMTYCLQSTWYIYDLKKAIHEMIRVTKHDGVVVFDIMNSIAPQIIALQVKLYKQWLFNMPRMLINYVRKKQPPRMSIYEILPRSPMFISRVLKEAGVSYFRKSVNTIDCEKNSLMPVFGQRLLYFCSKTAVTVDSIKRYV